MTKTTELRVITEANGYDLNYVKTAIQQFEKKRQDVKVTLVQAEDSYGVMDQFNSGGADLLHIREGEYMHRIKKGIVRDLMPFLQVDPSINMDDIYKGALNHPLWEEKLAALPVADMSVPQIFFNKKLFAEAGVPFPTEGWTAEQFLDAAIRLTKPGETPEKSQYGVFLYVDVEHLEPFLMRRGGQYLAEDGSTGYGYADSPLTESSFKWIVDLFRVHRVAPMPGIDFGRIYRTNQLAMIYDFSWSTDAVAADPDLSQTYGVVGLPHFEGGVDTNMMYSTGYGIPTVSKQPEMAWELLRELAFPSTEPSREAYWGAPITKSLAEEQGRLHNPWWQPTLYYMDRIQKNAYLHSSIWNRSRQSLNQDIEKMIVEGADIKETLSRWAKLLDC